MSHAAAVSISASKSLASHSEPTQQTDTIQSGHPQVAQNDVDLVRPSYFEGGEAVVGNGYLVAVAAERVRQHDDGVRLVSTTLAFSSTLARAARPSWGAGRR